MHTISNAFNHWPKWLRKCTRKQIREWLKGKKNYLRQMVPVSAMLTWKILKKIGDFPSCSSQKHFLLSLYEPYIKTLNLIKSAYIFQKTIEMCCYCYFILSLNIQNICYLYSFRQILFCKKLNWNLIFLYAVLYDLLQIIGIFLRLRSITLISKLQVYPKSYLGNLLLV